MSAPLSHISPRSRLVALILCFFAGFLGAHRFYVGKVGTAVLMVVTIGGLGIWSAIDLILVAVGAFADKEGRLLLRWEAEPELAVREDERPAEELKAHVERIDGELADLQAIMQTLDRRLERAQAPAARA